MNFGKNILEKCGWKEGERLGKDQSGIAEALKATLKFDTSGLGFDKGAEYKDNWWQKVYNEASSNLKVIDVDNKIAFSSYRDGTTNKLDTILPKPTTETKYTSFINASTLTDKGEQSKVKNNSKSTISKTENNDDANEHITHHRNYFDVLDDELLSACHGRTGHKNARHGIKQTGKLKRLAEQERELLANIKIKDMKKNWINTENDEKNFNKKNRKSKVKEKSISKLIFQNNYITKRDTKGKITKRKIDKHPIRNISKLLDKTHLNNTPSTMVTEQNAVDATIKQDIETGDDDIIIQYNETNLLSRTTHQIDQEDDDNKHTKKSKKSKKRKNKDKYKYKYNKVTLDNLLEEELGAEVAKQFKIKHGKVVHRKSCNHHKKNHKHK